MDDQLLTLEGNNSKRLPYLLQAHVEDLLGSKLIVAIPVGGGSINKAFKIETENSKRLFLKWNNAAPVDFFLKEREGLNQLASAKTGLHIPKVKFVGKTGDFNYMLTEYIEENKGTRQTSALFGRQLAELHKITANFYGLEYDNYIGRLKQPNAQCDNWIDFFIENRLQFQLKHAVDAGKLELKVNQHFNHLYKKLADIFPEEPASLLHGDLWGGNYFFDEKGKAAIFDPAVYYGNREIEIAFTHLFGGFSGDFHNAYQEAWPLEPGFSGRKDIYNLYPLLTHTNMFGGHYGGQVERIVRRFA